MADKETIVKDLKQILVEDLFVSIPENEIKLDDALGEDLGVDSVGFVELIAMVEDKFAIQISENEAASGNLRTLDRLSDVILAKIAAERGAHAVSEIHG
jgi:acyl carrier protein